ncbi:MAG: class I SAM-dependent methyltransferase [Planctomycetota bacterium]
MPAPANRFDPDDLPADAALGEEIAASLDADSCLLPHLPYLLQDLDDFGARPSDVRRALTDVTLPDHRRVLDLGCGKGAVPRLLALEAQRRVLGVDAMPAFVAAARDRAAAAGVANDCRFVVGDLRAAVARSVRGRPYGMVCLLAAVGALGDLPETVGSLRRWVEPGGLILIDDAYCEDDAREELPDCLNRGETHAALTSHGDRIIAEVVCDGPETTAFYSDQIAKIERRALQLAAQCPDDADDIHAYVARQREEIALLTGPVVGALWVLRRG